jgi:hypothetical protein
MQTREILEIVEELRNNWDFSREKMVELLGFEPDILEASDYEFARGMKFQTRNGTSGLLFIWDHGIQLELFPNQNKSSRMERLLVTREAISWDVFENKKKVLSEEIPLKEGEDPEIDGAKEADLQILTIVNNILLANPEMPKFERNPEYYDEEGKFNYEKYQRYVWHGMRNKSSRRSRKKTRPSLAVQEAIADLESEHEDF